MGWNYADFVSGDPVFDAPPRERNELHNADVDEFDELAEPPTRRMPKRLDKQTRQRIFALLNSLARAHPMRVNRLRRDLEWLNRKAVKKHGSPLF